MLVLAETPEALLQAMSTQLSQVRDPRARHWFILPGRGRAEYILQHWASRSGIAAHSQQVELRELIEQAASGDQRLRFDFDRLRLACASALPNLCAHPEFPVRGTDPLDPISASILNWATTLAKALDDGLRCRHAANRWAPDSFLHALANHPLVQEAVRSHIGRLTLEQFEQATRLWIASWSKRNGVPHLWIQLDAGIPKVQFDCLGQLLQTLSEQHQNRIHLFALSPSSEYWAEAQLRSRNSQAEPDPDRHPGGLLWSLGRSSQDLHRQLAGSFLAIGDGGTFLPSTKPPATLLGQLQLACRKSEQLAPEDLGSIDPNDSSLTIHSARSTLRELEICRDRILQARTEMADLRYEEILVLLADPKRQAPFLQAAFRTGENATLPFRMFGFGQSVPSQLAESLKLLIDKLRGRLNLEDLQTLIENPLIAQKFQFHESLEMGHDLVLWLKEAQFRWGLNPAHRFESQAISEERWNLFWAMQRLGLGAVVSPDSRSELLHFAPDLVDAVPLERASGLSLSALARLAKFTTAIEHARHVWTQAQPKTIPQWNEHLEGLLGEFIDCSNALAADHYTALIGTILPQLRRADPTECAQLTPEAYIRLVTEKLSSIAESGARGVGGISVADLRQCAGVPARLILIAGLNDGTFPRRDDRPEWHPLAKTREVGDPLQRDSDRHALLLAILACGQRLVLSYQGGSDQDAKKLPPSTALADLLAAIEHNQKSSTPNSIRSHQFEFEHPLNGFSPAAFFTTSPINARSFLRSDYAAAENLQRRENLLPLPGLWSSPLIANAKAPAQQISINSLHKLFEEPAQIFAAQLGIRRPEVAETLDGGDLFDPDALQKWALCEGALNAKLQGAESQQLFNRIAAAGLIPRGELGLKVWTKIQEAVPELQEGLACRHSQAQTFRLTLTRPDQGNCLLEGSLKTGWFRLPDTQNAVFLSVSSPRLKHELAFCLDALVLAASVGPDERPILRAEGFFKGSKNYRLELPAPAIARQLIEAVLPLYELAQQIPLPFWPNAAEKALPKKIEIEQADVVRVLEAAFGAWANPYKDAGPPEAEKPTTSYVFRGCANPFLWEPKLPTTTDWLGNPNQPLAWRVLVFIHQWKSKLGLE